MLYDPKKDPYKGNVAAGFLGEVTSFIVVTAWATGISLFLIACIIAWDKLFN